jgi:hypothetical protein
MSHIVREGARMLVIGAIAYVSCTLVCPTASAQEAKAITPAPHSAPRTQGKLVCRKEQPTGTRIPRTICRTAAQRALERSQGREFLRSIPTQTPDPRIGIGQHP